MPKLVIDGCEIEVPKGTKVIEAAERLGIMIPRFCYHPALGSVGACRVCAVKFLQGPVKGVQMSCMVEARDGMVVSTQDEEAVDFRRQVIEWLMLNHPLDCPVCDEGGHCLLQDMTVSGGHGIRRYLGKKRTYHDQYLGPLVQHEMNRCIHCWRCRRFYQEIAGYHDLGAMQIGSRTYFGRISDGTLESPFSGNLIDICPTGVYTDKPSRFMGRRWDYERAPSICVHCSLGCNTVASARYREVVRLEARFHEAVNGYFICDRGRFGFGYSNHPERPRAPRMDGERLPWVQAVEAASKRLTDLIHRFGPGAVACAGSLRSSVETQAMLKWWCRLKGLKEPVYFVDPYLESKVRQAVHRLDSQLAVSLREIERSDFIIAIGADPINEAPMLALAMRQACCRGAPVVVIDPRPIFLPHGFVHVPVAPGDLGICLGTLVKAAVRPSTAEGLGDAALKFYESIPADYSQDPLIDQKLKELAVQLSQSCKPVIICGTEVVPETMPVLAADYALLLKAASGDAGLFYLLPGANAFGAALLSSGPNDFYALLERIEDGAVKALILVESDPFHTFSDRRRLEQAMGKLDLILTLDYVPSETTRRAHILLPTRTLFECEGSFINQEGRLQFVRPVHHGGAPIAQISAGQHPPRSFRPDIPGGEARPAWKVLAELAPEHFPLETRAVRQSIWEWLAREITLFTRAQPFNEREADIKLALRREPGDEFRLNNPPWTEKRSDKRDDLELLLVDWTFGTEELSGYFGPARQVESAPRLYMQEQDAARLGFKTGEKIIVRLEGGSLELELFVAANMAQGVMIAPRHRELAWQKMKRVPVIAPIKHIEKA
jgi:NADH-quinone oxidoreductase subunit G